MQEFGARQNQDDGEREGLPAIRPNVAGIDIGSQVHWVCGPRLNGSGREEETFGATTPELLRMAQWLR